MTLALAVLLGVAIGAAFGYIARDMFTVRELQEAEERGWHAGFTAGEQSALAPLNATLDALEASWPRG